MFVAGMVNSRLEDVIEHTRTAVLENRLYRCMTCDSVVEFHVAPEWLRPGGMLYDLARRSHGTLSPDKSYNFTLQGQLTTLIAQALSERSVMLLCEVSVVGSQARALDQSSAAVGGIRHSDVRTRRGTTQIFSLCSIVQP